MNVYIVTENSYFFAGVKAKLSLANGVIKQVAPNSIGKPELARSNKKDVFVFYIPSYSIELLLLIVMESFSGKFIFIPTSKNFKFVPSFNKHIVVDAKVSIDTLKCLVGEVTESTSWPVEALKNKLTSRERTILIYILNGMNILSISQVLQISIKTVYAHRRNALSKLGGRNVFEIWPAISPIMHMLPLS